MNTTANTPSRDSHEVRKRLNARQAFFGLARWKVDDSRPNTIRLIATRPPMTSCAGVNPPPSLNVSAMNSSENRPKPAPDATVKKMTEKAGYMNSPGSIYWAARFNGAPACWRAAGGGPAGRPGAGARPGAPAGGAAGGGC